MVEPLHFRSLRTLIYVFLNQIFNCNVYKLWFIVAFLVLILRSMLYALCWDLTEMATDDYVCVFMVGSLNVLVSSTISDHYHKYITLCKLIINLLWQYSCKVFYNNTASYCNIGCVSVRLMPFKSFTASCPDVVI